MENSGPATTGTITVTDDLPPGLGYVSASGDNWNCSADLGTVTCATTASIPALGISSPITLTVAVNGQGEFEFELPWGVEALPLRGGGPGLYITNTATVAATSANIANAAGTDIVVVATDLGTGQAGLFLSLTRITPMFEAGGSGAYSILVQNATSAASTGAIGVSVTFAKRDRLDFWWQPVRTLSAALQEYRYRNSHRSDSGGTP